jgi:hypothetical protein
VFSVKRKGGYLSITSSSGHWESFL